MLTQSTASAFFDKLKPLIINGPVWTDVKMFGPKRDGSGAILALKYQAEHSTASKQQKSAA